MVSRALIDERKRAGDSEFFLKILSPTNDERSLRRVLECLGRLPSDFNRAILLNLLKHEKPEVRLLAVKNLGKLKDATLLNTISQFAKREANTLVRREAISAIGRIATLEAIPFLSEFLKDVDPKVVLQAIRGLIRFKRCPEVQLVLKGLVNHPNEMIQHVLSRELTQKVNLTRKDISPDGQNLESLKNIIVHADVREALGAVPDESIHLTFTSPPYYNARDYTLYESYEVYLKFLTDIFREVHRITKEGRFFALNTSPVIIPRMSRAHSSRRYAIPFDIHPMLTQIGWEFIEDIIWVKPERCAKNRNGGFFQHRKPLAYKANAVSEYVMVYRKKTDKLIDWNMHQYSKERVEASKVKENYEKTNVWHIHPASDKLHPAIFPVELASRIIQFYSFKEDLVFDPFAGVGTVGVASLMLERFFLLMEREGKYVQKAIRAIDGSLFNTNSPRCLNLNEFMKLRKTGSAQ